MGLSWEPMLPRPARGSDLARYSRTCVIMVVFFAFVAAEDELRDRAEQLADFRADSRFCRLRQAVSALVSSLSDEDSEIVAYHMWMACNVALGSLATACGLHMDASNLGDACRNEGITDICTDRRGNVILFEPKTRPQWCPCQAKPSVQILQTQRLPS